MKTNTRVYLVKTKHAIDGHAPMALCLVRATNRAQAERHVARTIITASVATQDELIEHLPNGIEVAGEQEEGAEQ